MADPNPRAHHPPGPRAKLLVVLAVALIPVGLVLMARRDNDQLATHLRAAQLDVQALQGPAPSYTLPAGPDGPRQTLASLSGHYALIHFWATWCPPCREELPSLEILARRLAGRLRIVAISADEEWGAVENFFGEQRPSFELLWDPDRAVAIQYGTEKYPESYLVDPRGQLVAKFTGPRDWDAEVIRRYFASVIP